MGKRRRTHPGAGARPAVTRPEDRRGGDANAHYDVGEARRYTSQNDKVQAELTACALDLLVLAAVRTYGRRERNCAHSSSQRGRAECGEDESHQNTEGLAHTVVREMRSVRQSRRASRRAKLQVNKFLAWLLA